MFQHCSIPLQYYIAIIILRVDAHENKLWHQIEHNNYNRFPILAQTFVTFVSSKSFVFVDQNSIYNSVRYLHMMYCYCTLVLIINRKSQIKLHSIVE